MSIQRRYRANAAYSVHTKYVLKRMVTLILLICFYQIKTTAAAPCVKPGSCVWRKGYHRRNNRHYLNEDGKRTKSIDVDSLDTVAIWMMASFSWCVALFFTLKWQQFPFFRYSYLLVAFMVIPVYCFYRIVSYLQTYRLAHNKKLN